MRALLKGLTEGALVGSGAAALARRLHAKRAVVLAYHNIIPSGERQGGDRSLHLPQASFAQQLDLLQETHEVVPLTEVLSLAPKRSTPRAAITFDDAYAGAATAGLEELRKRGLPATVFVVPGMVGGQSFWWDELADHDRGEVAPQVRTHALDLLAGQHPRILSWAAEQGIRRRAVLPVERTATEAQLTVAAATPGITLGSHTWSHPNLARLSSADCATELAKSLDWLKDRFPVAVPWLSYPYGRTSPEAREAVQQAGYEVAFLVEGGWVPHLTPDRWALPRVNIPAGLSLAGFTLRVSGIGAS